MEKQSQWVPNFSKAEPLRRLACSLLLHGRSSTRLIERNPGVLLTVPLLAAVFIIFAISIYVTLSTIYGFSRSDLGQIGDFFGGMLNPALSFISILALIATILVQVSELKETRRELKASRLAHEESARASQKHLEHALSRHKEELTLRVVDQHFSASRIERLIRMNSEFDAIERQRDPQTGHLLQVGMAGAQRNAAVALFGSTYFLEFQELRIFSRKIIRLVRSEFIDEKLLLVMLAPILNSYFGGFKSRFEMLRLPSANRDGLPPAISRLIGDESDFDSPEFGLRICGICYSELLEVIGYVCWKANISAEGARELFETNHAMEITGTAIALSQEFGVPDADSARLAFKRFR